jgi:gliding motility-associated-like protein
MGCIDSTSVAIAPQQGGIYYIPNSFTPDGDLYNQVFKPFFTAGFDIYQYNMQIYNRWGEIIFETNNLDFGWDGSYGLEGTDALPGSYTYKINIKVPDNDDRVIITGHVNLIR